MNDKKICFIMCSNNETYAEECIRYINELSVPKGYVVENVVIRNAVSMTSGYNEAKSRTDAKYKVYLHQDVLITNKKIISDILSIFQKDSNVGMIGVVGNRSLSADGAPWSDGIFRRVGQVYADRITESYISRYEYARKPYEDVIVIDGMLMATQYDVKWREDLFAGWHFYDCSQSVEFIKAGYKVVVPYMEKPWVFHDNDILHVDDYEKWRDIFEKEYKNVYYNWTDEGRNYESSTEKDIVIYQVFKEGDNRLNFPYAPLYKENDKDYVCFTDWKKAKSDYWRMVYVDTDKTSMEQAVNNFVSGYKESYEVKSNQVILSGWSENIAECFIDIPKLNEIENIEFDENDIIPTRDSEGNYIYKKNPVYTGGRYDGREFILTIGVPVSNQIATIEDCMKGIKPILDELDAELVVVDTGSKDGTIEVCKKYGARVVEFPWCDNMSAARNVAVNNAKGLWYMSIDDDEIFQDVQDIIDFFKEGTYRKYQMASYIQRNYLFPENNVYKDDHVRRMVRMTENTHFEGRIHDCIVLSGNVGTCKLNSVAVHYGFRRDDYSRVLSKYQRNVTILLKDVYEFPEDTRYNFQLANEFRCVAACKEAMAFSVKGMAVSRELNQIYFEKMHTGCLLESLYDMRSDNIFKVTEAVIDKVPFTYAERALYYFNLAEVGFEKNRPLDEIVSYADKYLYFRKEYIKDPTFSQLNSFSGIHSCEGERFLSDIRCILCAAYAKDNKYDEALRAIEELSIDDVFNEKYLLMKTMLHGNMEFYTELLGKFTSAQAMLWYTSFLREFQCYLREKYDFKETIRKYILYIQKVNMNSLEECISDLIKTLDEEKRDELFEMVYRANDYKKSIHELYFDSIILKSKLKDKREDRLEIFFKYAENVWNFVTGYYSEKLIESDSCIIPGDELAGYYVHKAVLCTLSGDSEGIVRNLRKALKSFPGFKEQISEILNTILG